MNSGKKMGRKTRRPVKDVMHELGKVGKITQEDHSINPRVNRNKKDDNINSFCLSVSIDDRGENSKGEGLFPACTRHRQTICEKRIIPAWGFER